MKITQQQTLKYRQQLAVRSLKKHAQAFKIASLQAAVGCFYNVLINHYVDPEGKLCNPPGVLTALTGFGVSSTKQLVSSLRSLKKDGERTDDDDENGNDQTYSKVTRKRNESMYQTPRNRTSKVHTDRRSSERPPLLRKASNLSPISSPTLRSSSAYMDALQIANEQQLQFDFNALFLCVFVAVTYISLDRWVYQAAIQMNVASTPLFLTLFVALSTEIVGRGQRCEHLKGAEAMARWTWIVFPLSIVVLITCGVRGASFFYLVILLRYTFDMYRTIYRYLTMDPTINDSLVFRGSFQLAWGCLVIPVVLLLSSIVSIKSVY